MATMGRAWQPAWRQSPEQEQLEVAVAVKPRLESISNVSLYSTFMAQMGLYCMMALLGGAVTVGTGAAASWLAGASTLGVRGLGLAVTLRAVFKMLGIALGGCLLQKTDGDDVPEVEEEGRWQKLSWLGKALVPSRLRSIRVHTVQAGLLLLMAVTIVLTTRPIFSPPGSTPGVGNKEFSPASTFVSSIAWAVMLQGVSAGMNACCNSVLVVRASQALRQNEEPDTAALERVVRIGQTSLAIAYCFGALIMPRLVAMGLKFEGNPCFVFDCLAGLCLAVGVWALAAPEPLPQALVPSPVRRSATTTTSVLTLEEEAEEGLLGAGAERAMEGRALSLLQTRMWCLVLALFLVVGCEMGASFGLGIYEERVFHTEAHRSATAPAAIWDGIIIGRFALLFIAFLITNSYVALIPSTLACALCATAIAVVQSPLALRWVCTAWGAAAACVFPLAITAVATDPTPNKVADKLGHGPARIMPILMQAGVVGELLFPVMVSLCLHQLHGAAPLAPVVAGARMHTAAAGNGASVLFPMLLAVAEGVAVVAMVGAAICHHRLRKLK